ncbi:MAG TPA: DUF4136 domain-containing protein [Terriglobales bacterium]|nr:DUF4136 domain-containing protein [Terriglobales bacterium]
MTRSLNLKLIVALFVLCAGFAAAQEVRYNYDRDADFSKYKTYQWVQSRDMARDQLRDQDIKRAIDEQLASKGLVKVDNNGDLDVTYQTSMSQEKQFNGWGMGPRWSGGMATATTSTIHIGTLVVDLYDPAVKQLVWRGNVTKELNPSKDPDKNYKNLQKAMAKLFKNYPPKAKK